ncbi:dihydropteroate synthase [Candidatus Micrarchaeota archaeon]|nr:dihydropteroate synthase [Candidatus Micrarchaeota archaeon]
MEFVAKNKTLDLSKPVLMGVLNVTPDSFSDGGQFMDPQSAVARGLEMARQGARIIDVGGQSTRPGAKSVGVAEEKRRVIPVIEALAKAFTSEKAGKKADVSSNIPVLISVDTFEPDVADAALVVGADIINDVTGFTNPTMCAVVGRHRAGAIVTHMQGTPETMQKNPEYADVVAEVKAFLKTQAAVVQDAGAPGVMVDPGIGFGKTLEHNLVMLKNLDAFCDLGYPVCVGVSRKSFIGTLTGVDFAEKRLEGSLAAVTACVMNGASVLRVHDVAECQKTLEVAVAMKKPRPALNPIPTILPSDEIRVQGIVVNAAVGILPKEKKNAQPLIVNVVASMDLRHAAKSQDVKDTLDYRRIVVIVEKTAASRHSPLLEGLAEEMAIKIKALGAARVSVQIVKPESLNNGVPSVTVER